MTVRGQALAVAQGSLYLCSSDGVLQECGHRVFCCLQERYKSVDACAKLVVSNKTDALLWASSLSVHCSKLVDMSEADLRSLIMYSEPAEASEQREMLKFAQIQAYCFMAQMKLDEAATGTKVDGALVNSAQGLLQRAKEIDSVEGMIVIMRGQVQMLACSALVCWCPCWDSQCWCAVCLVLTDRWNGTIPVCVFHG